MAGSLALGLTTVLILLTAVPEIAAAHGTSLGWDYDLYMTAARRWLAGGPYFEPYQLSGPYEIHHGDILYPPVALWLFVPFTILPGALWWLIPGALLVGALAWLRPTALAWPVMALCLVWPPTLVKIATGNPVMWAAAAMAAGVVITGPAVLVLIKPSLGLFAAWGIRQRRWWLWLAAFATACLPFGTMWADWLASLANAQGGGLLYSWQEVPMLLLPIAAWLGRSGGPMAPRSQQTTETRSP